MRKDFIKAAKKGSVIKSQNYTTERGAYKLVFVNHEGDIYFYKYLNGKLVECCNLSKSPIPTT